MKHTPILLLTLIAASASAAPGDVGLNYNRVSVGYLSSDAMKGFTVGGTAELANSGVLISGSYSDVDGKGDLTGLGGYMTGFGLAYKFNVGAGDLAVGLGYQQGQFGASNAFAVAEQTSSASSTARLSAATLSSPSATSASAPTSAPSWLSVASSSATSPPRTTTSSMSASATTCPRTSTSR